MSVPGRKRDPEESWIENRDQPYATLISHAGTYFHPEVHQAVVETLQRAANRPVEEQNIDTRTFVQELRQALLTHAKDLPGDELFEEAEYSDGSDLAFLRRVWRELFPGTPVPGGSGGDG